MKSCIKWLYAVCTPCQSSAVVGLVLCSLKTAAPTSSPKNPALVHKEVTQLKHTKPAANKNPQPKIQNPRQERKGQHSTMGAEGSKVHS